VRRARLVIHGTVLLALIVLAFSLLFGGSAPTQTASVLPATQPGAGRDEGTFLITAADDGSRAVYFVAGNARHSILSTDMQLEVQRNPLWPVRTVSREDVVAIPEGAPIGGARPGLVSVPTPADDRATEDAPTDTYSPADVSEPMASDPVQQQPITYILKPGDNLTRLSAQYGTSIQAILAANNLSNANRIYVGQALVIPTSPQVVEVPSDTAPVADETSPEVANAAPAEVADQTPADEVASTTYTVKRGDSATTIARQFGVSVDDLLAANGVANRNRVYVGQTLVIPTTNS
jgi:LysM repeat protein